LNAAGVSELVAAGAAEVRAVRPPRTARMEVSCMINAGFDLRSWRFVGVVGRV
jgi:hypothetical protein